MFKVRRKRCATCIYGPRHLSASRASVATLEKECADKRMPGFFRTYRACHHHPDTNDVCCRGFWDRHKDHFTLGQIAQRLNFVEFVDAEHKAAPQAKRAAAKKAR